MTRGRRKVSLFRAVIGGSDLAIATGKRLWVKPWWKHGRAVGVIALVGLLMLAPVPWPVSPVMAATIDVTTTADEAGTNPSACSLREAIIAANTDTPFGGCPAGSGADTIVLQARQTYTLDVDSDGWGHVRDSGASDDDLDIVTGSTITIQGNGATIERSAALRCTLRGFPSTGEFRIFHVAHGGTLTLQNVRVRNGCANDHDSSHDDDVSNSSSDMQTAEDRTFSDDDDDDRRYGRGDLDDGGGILVESGGVLTVIDSTISENYADSDGGGIDNDGVATIIGSTIWGNSADDGGGIENHGRMTITDSTISGNYAEDGGGIDNDGVATIMGSVISGNTASDDGGGIENDDILTITNSTISGNRAFDDGGGIQNDRSASLSFVTITLNSATFGGGIYNDSWVNIKNSIVGDNTAVSGPNCSGRWEIIATGINLATDTSCRGFTRVSSTQLNLGPLANNGGPTQTHALLPGSVAIDAATDCTDLAGNPVPKDQRGAPRPQGSACDVGAYEAGQAQAALPTLTITGAGTGNGVVLAAGITCAITAGRSAGDCSESYAEGTDVALTATPNSDSTFAGWGGDCSGTSPTTSIKMNAPKTCTATFQRK